MTELPSGTVTFLFTDIEGSTRLLQELGRDSYARVLADHERILRSAVQETMDKSSTRRATRSSSDFAVLATRSMPRQERSVR
jgi:hypothetical protein